MKLPKLISGEKIPNGIQKLWIREEKERAEIKEQRRHDFLIATYGTIGGIVGGVVSSLIVMRLQGLL